MNETRKRDSRPGNHHRSSSLKAAVSEKSKKEKQHTHPPLVNECTSYSTSNTASGATRKMIKRIKEG